MRTYFPGWGWDTSICPADQHFLEWMVEHNHFDKTIFHMGTGKHHMVGQGLYKGNSIIGATLSPEEVAAYIELVTDNNLLFHNYQVLFTDIHFLNPLFLPTFDIVTLFHLAEIYNPVDDGMTLEEVVRMFKSKLNPGGVIVHYNKSSSRGPAIPILERVLNKVETYKTMDVYA